MYVYLCSLSISFGIPVLPVVNVTRACSTVSTSKGLSSSLALDGKLRSLTSMCIGMARRDGRMYCVEWGGGEEGRRGRRGGKGKGGQRSWKERETVGREGVEG